MNPVLVIGASRGIGLELVRQYREAGAAVTATARSDEGLAALQALGARPLRLDLLADEFELPPSGARYSTVIFNAGVYGPRTQGLQPPSRQAFDAVMHTNVLGAMRLLPAVAGLLQPGEPLPRLAVLSSRMGAIGSRTGSAGWLYRASKAALNSVLKDVSLSLQGQAVCVALHPGWVRTDMGGSGADLDVATSVGDLRRTLAALQPADNGGFFNHDGTPLSW